MAGENLFDLYQLMVEEARETRAARRELANTFLSLNLAGVGALGFLAKGEIPLPPAILIWCAVALVFVCLIWRTSNAYYTRIIWAKFEVLNDLENRMGERPFQKEWEALQSKRGMRFFTLERAMPIVFIIGYIGFVVFYVSADDAINTVKGAWEGFTALIARLT